MVAPEPLVRPIERLQQNLSISVPTLSQIAAEAAFDGAEEMEAIKRGYVENRRILIEGLPKAGLSEFLPADGAFYLYANVSKFTSDSFDFAKRMLEQANVAATPGVDFDPFHADYLPRGEGEAQGATIYTVSDKATDAEAERLAESENRADAIGGVNLTQEPTEVADILIDLAQRETRTFSNRFARLLMGEMKTATRLHKHPLKSAGFRVLKAPDVPSVLVELGYVSNKSDLEHLTSDSWRSKTVGAMAQAIDVFLAKRLATAGPAR